MNTLNHLFFSHPTTIINATLNDGIPRFLVHINDQINRLWNGIRNEYKLFLLVSSVDSPFINSGFLHRIY